MYDLEGSSWELPPRLQAADATTPIRPAVLIVASWGVIVGESLRCDVNLIRIRLRHHHRTGDGRRSHHDAGGWLVHRARLNHDLRTGERRSSTDADDGRGRH